MLGVTLLVYAGLPLGLHAGEVGFERVHSAHGPGPAGSIRLQRRAGSGCCRFTIDTASQAVGQSSPGSFEESKSRGRDVFQRRKRVVALWIFVRFLRGNLSGRGWGIQIVYIPLCIQQFLYNTKLWCPIECGPAWKTYRTASNASNTGSILLYTTIYNAYASITNWNAEWSSWSQKRTSTRTCGLVDFFFPPLLKSFHTFHSLRITYTNPVILRYPSDLRVKFQAHLRF